IGAGLGRATVALVGWFGPRGVASVVFALLALEDLGSRTAHNAVAVITITVMISVVAHGATADPLAARYARLLARQADGHAAAEMPGMGERGFIRRPVRGHGAGGGGAPATGGGSEPAYPWACFSPAALSPSYRPAHRAPPSPTLPWPRSGGGG